MIREKIRLKNSQRHMTAHFFERTAPCQSVISRGDSLPHFFFPVIQLFVVITALLSLSLFDLCLWSQMLAEGCNPPQKILWGQVWTSLWCSSPKTANTDSTKTPTATGQYQMHFCSDSDTYMTITYMSITTMYYLFRRPCVLLGE